MPDTNATNAATGGMPGEGGIPSQAAGAQQAQQQSGTGGTPAGNGETPNPAEDTTALREAIRKERERADAAEKRLKALDKAEQERATAEMSELEKAQKRVAELERQSSEFQVREQERNVRLAAVEAATRLNFRNPDLAYRLIERSEIEYADDGTPKNVANLLKAVLDKDPYLARTGQPDYGGGQRGATPSDKPGMNEILRAAARGG